MSRGGLDELDSAIVRALQSDGRRAFSSIATDLGVSEGAVRYYKLAYGRGVGRVVDAPEPTAAPGGRPARKRKTAS